MQTVTFETAQKLKEAGFPQPEPKAGQFWYDNGGNSLVLTIYAKHMGECNFRDMRDSPHRWYKLEGSVIFAPSATDILRQLPSHLSLSHDTGEFWCGEEKDRNPAEAAAAAWLALKEK